MEKSEELVSKPSTEAWGIPLPTGILTWQSSQSKEVNASAVLMLFSIFRGRWGFFVLFLTTTSTRSILKLRLEIALTKRKWQKSGTSHAIRTSQLFNSQIIKSSVHSNTSGWTWTAGNVCGFSWPYSLFVPFPEEQDEENHFRWLEELTQSAQLSMYQCQVNYDPFSVS